MHDPLAPIQERNPDCYVDQFAHKLPHRDEVKLRPCGHLACDPHTITYFGRGIEGDAREGDYCIGPESPCFQAGDEWLLHLTIS